MHSFKFTMSLQNKSCSKEISVTNCGTFLEKKKITLASGNAGDEKIFTRAATNYYFLINLTEFY